MRHLITLLSLTVGLYAQTVYQPTTFVPFGDSITALTGCSTAQNCYTNRIAAGLQISSYTNQGWSGGMAADISTVNMFPNYGTTVVTPPTLKTLMIGTNEANVKGAGAYEATYTPILKAMIVWSAITTASRVAGSTATTTGTCANDTTFSTITGVSCTANASTASMSITTAGSNPIYILYRSIDSDAGTWTYKVDAGSPVAVSTAMTTPIATTHSTTMAVALVRVTGLSAGAHTVLFTQTHSGTMAIEALATVPTSSANNPYIIVGEVPHEQSGTNASAVAAYVADVDASVAQLAGDGLQVFLAPVATYQTGYGDMYDQLHPNDLGHGEVAAAFFAAVKLQAAVTSPTTIYLRSSAPAAARPIGVTQASGSQCGGNTGQAIAQTDRVHGFNAGDQIVISGVCTSQAGGNKASPLNGLRYASSIIDSTHFCVSDQSNTPITTAMTWLSTFSYQGGSSIVCNSSVQFTGKVTPYTLGNGPLGILDGLYGDSTRRLAFGVKNGLLSLTFTGCPSACVATIETTFDPTAMQIPVAMGNSFAIWNTTSQQVNTQNVGEGMPYTVGGVTNHSIVTNPVSISGASNGTYTLNPICGNNGSTYGIINGTDECVRISFVAWYGNQNWANILANNATSNNAPACAGSPGNTTGNYKAVCYSIQTTPVQKNTIYVYTCHNFAGCTVSSDWTQVTNEAAVYDGGNADIDGNIWNYACMAAVHFFVDQLNQGDLDVMTYAIDNPERGFVGASFFNAEDLDATAGFDQSGLYWIPWVYQGSRPFISPTSKTTFLNKLYNNIDDPIAGPVASTANQNLGSNAHNHQLGTGTFTAITSSTITISSGDTQGTNYYAGSTVQVGSYVSGHCYGAISAYNATTKVATLTSPGWLNGPATCTPPSAPGTYLFMDAATASSTTATYTAGITVTSSHTNFGSDMGFVAGDMILLENGKWGFNTQTFCLGEVTAVTDNTSTDSAGHAIGTVTVSTAKCGIGYQNTIDPSDPQMIWRFPKWVPGDVGIIWSAGHSGTVVNNTQAYAYPGNIEAPAGYTVGTEGGNHPAFSSSLPAVGISTANDDSRGGRLAMFVWGQYFDWQLRHYMQYETGSAHSSDDHYTLDTVQPGFEEEARDIALSIPTFPSMDLSGNWNSTHRLTWATAPSLFLIYNTLPDVPFNGSNYEPHYHHYGGEPGGGWNLDEVDEYVTGALRFEPTSNLAGYYRSYMQTRTPSYNVWTYQSGTASPYILIRSNMLVTNDPRIPVNDYSVLPHQYLFQQSSYAQCAILTGWPCPAQMRGDIVISTTGLWSQPLGTIGVPTCAAHGCRTDTHLFCQFRTYGSDYDAPDNGNCSIYKVGFLLGNDNHPPNAVNYQNVCDGGSHGTMYWFGGACTIDGGFQNSPTLSGQPTNWSPIIRWWHGNAGGLGNYFGDQNSQAMVTCGDLSAVYDTPVNYLLACRADSKPTSGDQFLFYWETGAPKTPTSIRYLIHYSQNGETTSQSQDYYNEGHTTCPGSGGCGSLNTNRVIQSLESNTPDGTGLNPTPQYGLITNFLYPTGNPTFLKWSCMNSGTPAECGPGGGTWSDADGYNANGDTDRVEVWGGSSVGATVSSMESLVVHKIAQSNTDTTLTTTALNVDSNWFGAQACGAVSCAVFVGARGGVTHSTITNFTTTHSGTAQYLIEGLTAGTYTVQVNGTQIGVYAPAADDTTIVFSSTSGTVSIFSGGILPTSVTSTTGLTPHGTVIIHEHQ